MQDPSTSYKAAVNGVHVSIWSPKLALGLGLGTEGGMWVCTKPSLKLSEEKKRPPDSIDAAGRRQQERVHKTTRLLHLL